ncbi:hypothetical protein SNE40_012827 [Patella caerulea]|uniref:PC-esterase domain-containing protein 1A n=1 Tax=Patella caerulea TaxID=87958 RepID=A0AAN8PW46_PATCE
MSELFVKKDVEKLLHNKFIIVLGSSVQRSMYKDLVKILKSEEYITDGELRAKGELNFQGDELLDGGRKSKMTNCISYREVREYKTDFHLIRFHFITRCYNKYVESIFNKLKQDTQQPDVVIINSCLWDITRYGLGTESLEAYRKNLHLLCKKLKEVLPSDTLVIWNSTMPVDKEARGGVFVPEVETAKNQLGVKILACNLIAHHIVSHYGFDYLDLHFFLRHHLHRRAEDGVHWDMTAHRRMTNLILYQISEAWESDFGKKIEPEPQKSVISANQNCNQNPLIASQTPQQNVIAQKQISGKKKNKRNRNRNKNVCHLMPYSHHLEDFTNDYLFSNNDQDFMFPQGPVYPDENVNPNLHNVQNNYQQNAYFEKQYFSQHHQQFQQNFQWQEYPQDNLQQRYGFCGYNNSRNRFQPYSNNANKNTYIETYRQCH